MNQNEINDNEHPQDSMKLFLSDDDSLQNILKSSDDNNVGNEKKVKQKSKHTMFKPLQFSGIYILHIIIIMCFIFVFFVMHLGG